MSESPQNKKSKLSHDNQRKRSNEFPDTPSKRSKREMTEAEEQERRLIATKRRNFITACERVSYNAYFDHRSRFLLVYIPACLNSSKCRHLDGTKWTASVIPGYAEETFKIDVKSNMWCEALEVCQMCITPQQYLSANALQDVVEIILNAHDDNDSYTIREIIETSQHILSNNFMTHPPCLSKSIRKCYNKFLTSPMDLKDKTFTNRSEFGCDKGIVKYCMNRLEYEISMESKDDPLVDKYENIPEEMKQTVKGLHWQKEKFEIFELLHRNDRIERLMAVLDSIIELLKFDLAIWHSRHTTNQGRHIMRSHKPLMANILWSDNVLYTGAVNANCRQILKIFVQFIHLGYPQEHIDIMRDWLNSIVQTFYICETNSNCDYPNTGKYSTVFAKEFYKIMSELPQDSILKVLEAIKPTYMQYLIGILHLGTITDTKEDDIMKILIEFIKNKLWTKFPASQEEPKVETKRRKPRKVKHLIKHLTKKLKTFNLSEEMDQSSDCEIFYPKQDDNEKIMKVKVDQNYVVKLLYIALQAYIEAFSIVEVQDLLETLNADSSQPIDSLDDKPEDYSYTVSEHFIKKYRSIYQMLKEVVLLLRDLKSQKVFPDMVRVFENVGLLGL